MPSARRRRFNVQHEIANCPKSRTQNETQVISCLDCEMNYSKVTKTRNKMQPNNSRKSFSLDVVTEYKSTTSTGTLVEAYNVTFDKEVTASSSNIDLFTMLNTGLSTVSISKENIRGDNQDYRKPIENKGIEYTNVKPDRNSRRDKYTHRVKVRSPKRKAPVIEKNICKKRSIAIDTVDWSEDLIENNEIEVAVPNHVTDVVESSEEELRLSSHSIEEICRICHSEETATTELGRLIAPCSCRGTVGRVHVKCLERWLTESGKSTCELCGTNFVTKRVHKFGVLKALAMWIFSNNSKHMMVDFFGIMIMTPIAVVAAGLTGKTFSGLMAQDQLTPWPLASTFVLACMTLVCYYCWIVSALTRHALGWWIWYRSHYEVRLQLQNDAEHSQPSASISDLY